MDVQTLPADVQSIQIEHSGANIPIHEHPVIKNVPDMPTLFKNYLAKDAEINRRIPLLGKDAKPEQVKEFWGKLKDIPVDPDFAKGLRGTPAKAEEYQYQHPQDAKIPMDEGLLNNFKAFAHKQGFSQQEFAEAIGFWNQTMSQAMNVFQAKAEESTAALKQKWGVDYDKNWADANEGMAKMFGGDQALVEKIASTGLGLTPQFAEAMREYWVATSEDTGGGGVVPKGSSVDEELKKFTTPDTPEFKGLMAGDPAMLKKRDEIYSKKYPGMANLG